MLSENSPMGMGHAFSKKDGSWKQMPTGEHALKTSDDIAISIPQSWTATTKVELRVVREQDLVL
jgi:hypothetical protein